MLVLMVGEVIEGHRGRAEEEEEEVVNEPHQRLLATTPCSIEHVS